MLDITTPQGTEHDSDVFDWLCDSPLMPIALPDMHRGNPVAHGNPTDREALARLADKMKAVTV
jgi:hypothetical protein